MYRLTPGWPINIETGESVNPETHPGYLAWLAAGNTPLPYEPPATDPKLEAMAGLAATDPEIARVGEDLIKLLISKGIIMESDIPSKAVERMRRRAEWRAALAK